MNRHDAWALNAFGSGGAGCWCLPFTTADNTRATLFSDGAGQGAARRAMLEAHPHPGEMSKLALEQWSQKASW